MELEDMKTAWSALEQKLDASERLNQQLLQKMTREKSFGRVNKVVMYEFIGLMVGFIVILIITPSILRALNMGNIYTMPLFGFVGLVVSAVLVSQAVKLRTLMRVDPAVPLKENLRHVERYNRHIAWERTANYIVFPIVLILGALALSSLPQGRYLIVPWVVLALAIFIGLVGSWFTYKKLNATLRSIKEGFRELEELD